MEPPVIPESAPRDPYPGPAQFVVCDHHCVRKLYPVVNMAVRNSTARAITVSTATHFQDADFGLEFNRRDAYGYRLVVDVGTSYTFPPNSSTTVSLAAADPNFFSKTMMVPLSMLWKPEPDSPQWQQLLQYPRKHWFVPVPFHSGQSRVDEDAVVWRAAVCSTGD